MAKSSEKVTEVAPKLFRTPWQRAGGLFWYSQLHYKLAAIYHKYPSNVG
jgi:hypothetical protein